MRVVFALLPMHSGYLRDVLAGISAYRAQRSEWRLVAADPPQTPSELSACAGGADGVITTLFSDDWESAASSAGCPVVNVAECSTRPLVPRIVPDNRAVGRLGAQHLIDQGFRRLAYAYKHGHHPTRQREGFEATARANGCQLLRLGFGAEESAGLGPVQWWRPDRDGLRQLPSPTGIMVQGDRSAVRLAETCHAAGLAVPQQIAIVGGCNDVLYCESSSPPLSSVDLNAQRLGYEAAHLLHQLMGGAAPPRKPRLIPPKGVVVRESSDIVSVDDPDLAKAVSFIRRNACGPITIDQVAEHALMCRRTLERRFRRHFGYTLYAEIRRVRLDRARLLLTETDMKIPQVADRCGYGHYPHFIEAFRKAIGTTPSAYRERQRTGV